MSNAVKKINAESLSGAQKVAALLLAMGKESADRVTSHFSPKELQVLIRATQSLPGMNADTLDDLIRQFSDNYEISGLAVSSTEFLKSIGSRQQKKPETDDDKDGEQAEFKPTEVSEAQLKKFFETEPALMSAILIDGLNDETVGNALIELDEAARNEILNIYLTRDMLGEEQEEVLKQELLAIVSGGESDEEETSKEIQKTAGLMAYFDDGVVENILKSVEDGNPDIAEKIRKSMFRFSQVPLLDENSVAMLVDKVDTDDLSAALSGAEATIVETLLKPLSQRNRRIIESELERAKTDEKKADAARKKISAVAITLAKNGELTLP